MKLQNMKEDDQVKDSTEQENWLILGDLIGNILGGVTAGLRMVTWDRDYLDLLQITMKAYFRYIDDTGQAPDKTEVRLRYKNGVLFNN